MGIMVQAAHLFVLDQDEARDFWVNKVGLELRSDVKVAQMGDFRWLTVGPVGQPDVSIVLAAIPGPPMADEQTALQIRDVLAKGFSGTVFLGTDDVQRDFEELSARGVEFIQEPFETPYGIDAGFRDPSGNSIRLTQVKADWAEHADQADWSVMQGAA